MIYERKGISELATLHQQYWPKNLDPETRARVGLLFVRPEALWDSALLAGISSSLTTTLMWILLLAVMTLFLSAFVIEAAGR
jgi:hypothetical protein